MRRLVNSSILWPLPVSMSNLHMRSNIRNNAMLGQFKYLLTSSCQFDCITYTMQNQKPCTAWSAHVRCSIRNSGMLSQFKSLNYDDWHEKSETATHDAQAIQSIIPIPLHAHFSILNMECKIRNYLNLNLNHAMLGQSELLMTKTQNQGLCNVQCSIKWTN